MAMTAAVTKAWMRSGRDAMSAAWEAPLLAATAPLAVGVPAEALAPVQGSKG